MLFIFLTAYELIMGYLKSKFDLFVKSGLF